MTPSKSSSAEKAGFPPDQSNNPFSPLADDSSIHSDVKSTSSSDWKNSMELQMQAMMTMLANMEKRLPNADPTQADPNVTAKRGSTQSIADTSGVSMMSSKHASSVTEVKH